ncbi:hypothetical protein KSP39_PZI007969 [Platanthera zijinensis]|uniref:Small auxin up regulated protein n=1 Tax=Platanthera zijinensis TaxID=2320716 RepID=A0AAP0BNJ2_9ASPA
MAKNSMILNIVRLRQMVRRWRIRSSSSSSSEMDVPAGHVVVCVGSGSRRFVVRAAHLNHPAFRNLLLRAEEEYGFSQPGPLSLPCEESLFLQILRQISSSYTFRLPSAEDFDYPATGCCSCCCVDGKTAWRPDALPLLHGYAEKQVW